MIESIKNIVNKYEIADLDTALTSDSITYCEILYDIETETGLSVDIGTFIECRTIKEMQDVLKL